MATKTRYGSDGAPPLTSGVAMDSGSAHHGGQPTRLLRKPRIPAPRPPPRAPPPSVGRLSPILKSEYPLSESTQEYMNSNMDTMDSPIPNVSPPPPSELFSRPHSQMYSSPPTRKGMLSRKTDRKYVLDPVHRGRTNLGTYVEGQTLAKPFRPRGPEGLPTRPPLRNPELQWVSLEDDRYYAAKIPAFTLQDFLLRMTETEHFPMERIKNVMLSRYNYKKLQKMLADHMLQQQAAPLSTIEFIPPDDLPHASPRVPHKQLLIEMAALVREQMSTLTHTDMKSVIRPLPRYSPQHKPGHTAPQTEILLYENDGKHQERVKKFRQDTELPGRETVFHGASARYFQGSRRSNSPFAAAEENLITPSELAILDSLMSGGSALSLKAHFISQLPDIDPLSKTITYLNLSFNDFRIVPFEVFEIQQLTTLKLRNNPLTEVPPEIGRLRHLRVLVLSFCLLSTLPINLFTLKRLQLLDVSYNRLSFVPQEIRHLRRLEILNLEGNQLGAMPAGALRLQHMKRLSVHNNFMHPLFWKEHSRNEPQRLADVAALTVKQLGLDEVYDNIPENIHQLLHSHSRCDCCQGPRYGPGFRTIRPVQKIFNIKNLPFLFSCCSPYCYSLFENAEGESLVDMLYGTLSGNTSS